MATHWMSVFVLSLFAIASSQVADVVKDQIGIKDESVSLLCDIPFAKGTHRVTWSELITNEEENVPVVIANGKEVVSGHKLRSHFSVGEHYTLTISKLNDDLPGMYICTSQLNATYSAKRVYQLDLVERVKCKSTAETLDFTEGQKTKLLCRTSYSGNAMPMLRWTRNDQPANASEDNSLKEAVFDANRVVVLDPVTGDDDRADYVCRMSVDEKTLSECKLVLNVKHALRKIDITPPSGDIHANELLTCTGKANPASTVTLKASVDGVQQEPVVGSNSASLRVPTAWIKRKLTVDCEAVVKLANGSENRLGTNASFNVHEQKAVAATAGVTDPMTIIIVIIVIAAIIAIIVIVAVIVVCKKRQATSKTTKEKSTKEEEAKKLYNEDARA